MYCVTANTKNMWLYTGAPKTGTTSMRRWLNRYKYIDPEMMKRMRKDFPSPNHQPVSVLSSYFSNFKDYYKVITVRNPFSRIVSLWDERGNGKDFISFLKTIKHSSDYDSHCPDIKYQHQWGDQTDKKTVYIKLEEIDESIESLCEIFRIEPRAINKHKNLPHLREGSRDSSDYRTYFNSDSDIELIFNLFREDFEKFEYTF